MAQSRFMEIEAILATQSSDDALPDATVATVTDALNSVVITKLQQQYPEDKNGPPTGPIGTVRTIRRWKPFVPI